MVKKKVDARIRTLIENGVALRHRTMFVIVGDRGRDQVVNLHYMLSKCRVRARPNVLWCYKKELGFSSNRKQRARKLNKDIKRGIRQPDEENPFELFIGATDIRYTFYRDTDKILGQTFGMCVLQDFSAITPNILARTIETVEGGGIVVLLIKTLDSLKQLYTMAMDVHSRYRTEAHANIVGRFNERFMLSLAYCKTCLVVDDELNILNISSHARTITKVNFENPASTQKEGGEAGENKVVLFENDHILSEKELELRELVISLRETQPIGSLVAMAKTLDQAKALLTFAEAISEKSLKATVALMAGRGRGKSAALGISLACAIAFGYSNIFVTAPSPENLRTVFEMAVKGFVALGYKEHVDFETIESPNANLHHAVVRINVFKTHRQTIQYLLPQDAHKLSQCELLVIDEAAAIPLPLVQRLIGNYLVFISSTVNGYEGTGRALSLKLIRQLREHSAAAHITALSQNNTSVQSFSKAHNPNALVDPTSSSSTSLVAASAHVASNLKGRTLREVTLSEPIRYAENDPVERWLNDLLCLNCSVHVPKLLRSAGGGGVPHPSACDLYYVDRDTLFSHHKASEAFLQRMVALYVSSHYKNTPNDLQLMSDAPQQHLFVLLGPVSTATAIPDILCVIQVAFEGEVTASQYIRHTARGALPSGDLIPWCISQQFQNSEFASLSGARVVRIAVHPELQGMGYGSRAIQLLTAYYEGKLTAIDEDVSDDDAEATLGKRKASEAADQDRQGKKLKNDEAEGKKEDGALTTTSQSTLLTEVIAPRKDLPPLLSPLSDRRPETLQWLGVSFGLTRELHGFWSKLGFVPLYIRQTINDVTGEHTCVMLRGLSSEQAKAAALSSGILHSGDSARPRWLASFHDDFRRRLTSLAGFDFRHLSSMLLLDVLQGGESRQTTTSGTEAMGDVDSGEKKMSLTEEDEEEENAMKDESDADEDEDEDDDDEANDDNDDNDESDGDDDQEAKAMKSLGGKSKNKTTHANETEMPVSTSLTERKLSALDTSAARLTMTTADQVMSMSELNVYFTHFDLKRLESYCKNLVDYHMIMDLLPHLARVYFLGRCGFEVQLNHTQSLLLASLGLQHKTISDVEVESRIGATQLLALFNKTMRKLSSFLRSVEERALSSEIIAKTSLANNKSNRVGANSGETGDHTGKSISTPSIKTHGDLVSAVSFPGGADGGNGKDSILKRESIKGGLFNELDMSAKQSKEELKLKQKKLLNSINLDEYAVSGTDKEWEETVGGQGEPAARISVSSSKEKADLRLKKKLSGGLLSDKIRNEKLKQKKQAATQAKKKPSHFSG